MKISYAIYNGSEIVRHLLKNRGMFELEYHAGVTGMDKVPWTI